MILFESCTDRSPPLKASVSKKLAGLALALGLGGPSLGAEPQSAPANVVAPQPEIVNAAQLRGLSVGELENLFRNGAPGPCPVGFTRGKVLVLSDYYRMPKVAARMSNL